MTKATYQIIAGGIIVILCAVLLNPFGIWMPTMIHMLVFTLLLAAFAVYVAFVMQEQGGDEREQEHRMFSGRVAFLSAALIAVCGIVYQGFKGPIDPWLVASLCVMLIAKIAGNLYSAKYR
jgi:purine-cytosine permease-like protein